MPDSSIAIFFSAPVRNRSNDDDYSFHQDPDFYYLTGFEQAECMLLIFKNPYQVNGQSMNEILYIAPKNKDKETWTGILATPSEATTFSGIKNVLLTSEFGKLQAASKDFNQVLYRIPTGVTDDKSDTLDLFNLIEEFKNKFSFPPPNGDTYLIRSNMKRLRETKQTEEIKLLRNAITISCDGHKEMMRTLNTGMTEYQVQAVGEYVFKKEGAEDVGYPSICGGGENSCVLHYEENRKKLEEGDLILLDMGAEYHGYSADVTRTLPVSGKFNTEQKIIYDLVKQAQDSAFEKCRPGNEFRDTHKAAVSVISNGLVALGIIKEKDDYKKYFMHGTSHYLGLDVHDAGTYGNLKPGVVLTVEPGIYIPENSPCDKKWWNIGVRIEDDILITENGHENLSIGCPSLIEEIEVMMNQTPKYFK